MHTKPNLKESEIAIVYDALCCKSGGDRVLLDICSVYPEAVVYSLIHDPLAVYPEINQLNIRTSWFQNISCKESVYKMLFYPLGIAAMEMLDLSGYKMVIMVSTHCSKYVKVGKNALVICFCFTPFRLAWCHDSYTRGRGITKLKEIIIQTIAFRLRQIDLKHSKKVKHFVAMTKECSERIALAYQRSDPIEIINPGINIGKYRMVDQDDGYYLVVSRLENYKRVDLAVRACNILKKRLIIVGSGSMEKEIVKIAGDTISFLKNVKDDQLVGLYSRCKALIFPQHEDYGLTAIEAIASGRPVIAYAGGGILDTMVPYSDNSCKFTAVLFHHQNVESIVSSILQFEKVKVDRQFISNHAKNFDSNSFKSQFKKYIDKIRGVD